MCSFQIMALNTRMLIMAASVLLVSACNSNTVVGDEQANENNSPEVLFEAPGTQRLLVAPHLRECFGLFLTLCMQTRTSELGLDENFFDPIDGFDYQWGFDYELLIRVTELEDVPADASSLRYELIEVVSQSDYQAGETFNFTATSGSESVRFVEPGVYRLAGLKELTCEPVACDSIDSAIEQEQTMLLNFQYGEQPGEPLQLLALLCAESPAAFNDACLGGG